MSVLDIKKALKSRLKPKNTADPLICKVDRLGELKAMLDPLKPVQDEYDKLKKELIAELTPSGDPAVDVTVSGDRHTLVLGPRVIERTVADAAKLHEVLGRDAFLAVMKPSLTELDKRLAAADKAKLITEAPGNRRFKTIVPIAPASA